MMIPSIVAAALLVFVAAASCFGIPAIIGLPGRVHTITTRILDMVFVGHVQGLDDGATLAVILMLISVVVLYVSTFIIGRKQYITVSGKSTRPNIVDLGRLRVPIFIFVCVLTTIIVFLPFITVGLTSITVNLGRDLSLDNITFRYWERIFTRAAILSSGRNSIIAATTAATVGMVISGCMAYLLMRTNTKGRRIPDFLITVGGGMPSIVIALGLIMTMSGRFTINIYNTLYIIIVAFMIKYTLMGMRTVVSSMSQVHPSLEEASQISGASWLRTTRSILMPLIAPSLVAGWFLIFMPSFYELTMSTLLQAPRSRTIGYELYIYQTYHSQQTASALATAILLMVIIVNTILYKLTKGEFSI
jgi:iron(III) transport system permease protein